MIYFKQYFPYKVFITSVAICALLIPSFTNADEVPYAVKKFNGVPGELISVDSKLFFKARDDQHGLELWKSDGTEAGTLIVKDIYLGPDDSLSGWAKTFTDVNNTLFFRAEDQEHNYALWKSDGTEDGTVQVSDKSGLEYYTNVNNNLFFKGSDGTHGWEIWKSDGTKDGTFMVKDIYPGDEGSWPRELTNVDGILFFGASDGTHGWELWKSDGTEIGTVMVKDITPGPDGTDLRYFTAVDGNLFFLINNAPDRWELWKSDGTEAGTVKVKGIYPGFKSSGRAKIEHFVNINGTLFFEANQQGYGAELWKSDGTENGTVMVKDINLGKEGSYPRELTNVNGMLFFTATYGENNFTLWKSDGTDAGTVMVKDISSHSLYNSDGLLFFRGYDDIHGSELWKSNGTEAGTVIVWDLSPGETSSNPSQIINIEGKLFFAAMSRLWTFAPEICGDGIAVITEECDDGNDIEDDGCSSYCKAGIAVPADKEHFSYAQLFWSPVLSFIPSLAFPISFGTYWGGEHDESGYTIQVRLDKFLEPVDVYGAYTISTEPSKIYVLNPDGTTFNVFAIDEILDVLSSENLPEKFIPWKSNVTGPINEEILRIPFSEIPQDIYSLYLLVTPANRVNSYYLWETYYSTIDSTIWEYRLDNGLGSAIVTFLTGPDGIIINKGSFNYSKLNNDFSGKFDGITSFEESEYYYSFSYESNGIAYNPSTSLGLNQSLYSLTVEGNFHFPSTCRGNGTYNISFTNDEWVSGISGYLFGELLRRTNGCVEWF